MKLYDFTLAGALLLIVGLAGILMSTDPKPCHKVNNPDLFTDAQLQAVYAGTNETYFANTLPKNVVVKWGDLSQYHYMGATYKNPDSSRTIVIDRDTNPTNGTAQLTEYHEICHVRTGGQEFDDHGPKFEACMVGLANSGAFKELW